MSKLVKILVAMTTCAFLFVGCGSKAEEPPKEEPKVEQNEEVKEEEPEEEIEEEVEEEVVEEEIVLLNKDQFYEEIDKLNNQLRKEFKDNYASEDMNKVLETGNKEVLAWDNMIDRIYKNIEQVISRTELLEILPEQGDWVSERSKKATEAAGGVEDSLEASAKRLDVLIKMTRERCYEIVEKHVFDEAKLEEFKAKKEAEKEAEENFEMGLEGEDTESKETETNESENTEESSDDNSPKGYVKKLEVLENEVNEELKEELASEDKVVLAEAKLKANEKWEVMLDEVYSKLENDLTGDKLKKVQDEQAEWVKLRDEKVDTIANADGDEESSKLNAADTLLSMNKYRCFELINKYME